MGEPEFLSILAFHLGPFKVEGTVITSWLIMLLIGLLCLALTRRLSVERPGLLQLVLEGVVLSIDEAIAAVLPQHSRQLLPFIGTLWIFLVVANLFGLIPMMHAPTNNLSTTAGLAFLVFLSVHWYGIRANGLGRYLRHYLAPNPLLLPFHLMGEISRTVALAVRLFGNIISLETAALLVLLVAGFLAPVPLFLLHIVEGLVQAYIFGMLALVYIASAIQSQQTHHVSKE